MAEPSTPIPAGAPSWHRRKEEEAIATRTDTGPHAAELVAAIDKASAAVAAERFSVAKKVEEMVSDPDAAFRAAFGLGLKGALWWLANISGLPVDTA